jgi:secondary thiamine-phosphate synthase enzyme
MESLNLRTTKRIELIDISDKIQAALTKGKVKEGLVVVFCPHTTAGLTINENADPSVKEDLERALSKLAPAGAGYAHSEGNSDAHIKSSLLSQSLTLLVEDGRLALGTWQGIYFCEGDGPRSREVWLRIAETRG